MKLFSRSGRGVALGVAGVCSALVLSGCGGGGAADGGSDKLELDMASFVAPDTGQGQAYEAWMNEVEEASGGGVEITPFWNGELLGAQEIKEGLTDGRAQLGNFSYAYTPTDFPLTQMVEVPFLGDNLGAQVTAMNRLYEENEEFRAEYEDKGIKVLSFVPVAPAVTGTKEPVDSVDWYRGKTVRASGAVAKAVEAVGGTPAPIDVNETYEAMERGTVDAYGGLTLDFMPSTGLYEVGPHIHDAGLGHFAVTTWAIGLDTWESMSPEQQGILDKASAAFPESVIQTTSEAEDEGCAVVLDAGGSVEEFPEAETAKWEEAIGDDSLNDWIELATQAGASDAAGMYEQMESYYREAESGTYADYQTGVQRCAAR